MSDRKFTLFAAACCWGHSAELGRDAEQCIDWVSGPAKNPASWAMAWTGDQKKPTAAERADLLRSIAGNPFRPVELPMERREVPCPDCEPGRPDPWCDDCSGSGTDVEWWCPWLTPQVVSLAHAAYDERPGRACETCLGGTRSPYPYAASGWETCRGCHGTGRIADGALDPATLSILADTLVDAGVPEEEACGDRWCRERAAPRRGRPTDCPGGCGGTGRVPHPLPAALREPVARYRGFWVVDLLIGRS